MKNKIKIFLLVLVSLFAFGFSNAHASIWDHIKITTSSGGGGSGGGGKVKSGILNGIKDDLVVSSGKAEIGGFSRFLKEQLFTVVFVIAVGMLLWVGIRIASARGNPEEFKKAWMHFLYILIGIFIVFASRGIVKLIVDLDIF